MPYVQPEGAIRTLSGTYADAIFSNDGSKLFTVSGNTLSVIDPATGATITSYTIGTQLGAMDISLDGQFLAIVEEQPAGGAGIFYRVDLSTGSVSTFNLPGTSALHDIGFLANGSVVVSQEISAPLRVVDLETGDYYQPSPAMRPDATVGVSADGTYVIAQPPGLDWPLHTYDMDTGSGYAVYYDPYGGASIGGPVSAVGAVSPDGSMVVQGMSMRVWESNLSSSFSINIGENNPAALAFSPDGTKLFVLSSSIDKVIVVSTSSWEVLASYPIEADAIHPLEWSAGALVPGEMMRVSGDGDYLSIVTPNGIQLINLNLVIEPSYDGGPGDDTIVGSGGPDTITGADGNDVLSGAGGGDTIIGGNGDDLLSGGVGVDTLTGGAGNDIFYFGVALEFANADEITDLSAGDTIQLDTAVFNAIEAGTLSASAFHVGSAAASADHRIIYNSSTGQILYDADGTGALSHRLIATVDPDTAVSADMFVAVMTGTETVESAVTYTLAENELNLVLTGNAATNGTGNGLDNEITGNAAANQLIGLDGADTLIGNGGDDYLDGGGGADQLIGGLGNDTYVLGYPGFFLEAIDTITELAGEGNDTIISSFSVYQLPTHVENVTLTGSAQSATGNANANILTGNASINVLSGLEGNDQLFGNAGNDSLQGDSGDDLLDGGDGNDSATYDRAESGVTVSLAITGPQDTGGAGTDTLVSIEILGGSDHTDFLTAGASGDSLFGWNGKDYLFGGAGDDELDGGAGNDVYMMNSAADHWTGEIVDRGFDEGAVDDVRFAAVTASTLTMFADDTGIERIIIGTGTGANAIATGTVALNVDASLVANALTMIGNNGANILTGTAFGDEIDGNAGADRLYGNAGHDVLDGGLDEDRLYGGLGNDVYVVENALDIISEYVGEGTDLVNSSVTYALRSNIENLTLTGSAAIDGTGNGLDNYLRGNGAANLLDGGSGEDWLLGNAGNDTLVGGSGNDVLNGGTGADMMTGGLNSDTYYVDIVADVVTENAGEGTDTVVSIIDYTLGENVENLTFLGVAVHGTGNALNNTIRGSNVANVLDGGAGADHLLGMAGNDIYIVDNAGDRVSETTNFGIDTVQSSVSFKLGANVENLTLTGPSAINGTGNGLSNTLIGNDAVNNLHGQTGNDTLIGNGGDDVLNGGGGADSLSGGSGDDIYYVDNAGDVVTENVGEGLDTVKAGVDWTLGANQEELNLTGSASTDATGNGLANVIRGNGGFNQLDGAAGADTIFGNSGEDILIGGAGRDTLVGGAGNDSFLFRDGDFGGATTGTADRITDFAEGDRIDLSLADADSSLAGDQAFAFIGAGAFTGTAGELRYEQIGDSTFVQGDVDGDGTADFMIRLDGLHTLEAGDFLI